MPVPRVLEPVSELSDPPGGGNLVIEGDNLQVMVSLRPQHRATIDVAYLDPQYNTGKNDFRYSDRRFHDPDADSDDAVYVSNEDGAFTPSGSTTWRRAYIWSTTYLPITESA